MRPARADAVGYARSMRIVRRRRDPAVVGHAPWPGTDRSGGRAAVRQHRRAGGGVDARPAGGRNRLASSSGSDRDPARRDHRLGRTGGHHARAARCARARSQRLHSAPRPSRPARTHLLRIDRCRHRRRAPVDANERQRAAALPGLRGHHRDDRRQLLSLPGAELEAGGRERPDPWPAVPDHRPLPHRPVAEYRVPQRHRRGGRTASDRVLGQRRRHLDQVPQHRPLGKC